MKIRNILIRMCYMSLHLFSMNIQKKNSLFKRIRQPVPRGLLLVISSSSVAKKMHQDRVCLNCCPENVSLWHSKTPDSKANWFSYAAMQSNLLRVCLSVEMGCPFYTDFYITSLFTAPWLTQAEWQLLKINLLR